jgi:hypothetical protein
LEALQGIAINPDITGALRSDEAVVRQILFILCPKSADFAARKGLALHTRFSCKFFLAWKQTCSTFGVKRGRWISSTPFDLLKQH